MANRSNVFEWTAKICRFWSTLLSLLVRHPRFECGCYIFGIMTVQWCCWRYIIITSLEWYLLVITWVGLTGARVLRLISAVSCSKRSGGQCSFYTLQSFCPSWTVNLCMISFGFLILYIQRCTERLVLGSEDSSVIGRKAVHTGRLLPLEGYTTIGAQSQNPVPRTPQKTPKVIFVCIQ